MRNELSYNSLSECTQWTAEARTKRAAGKSTAKNSPVTRHPLTSPVPVPVPVNMDAQDVLRTTEGAQARPN